MNKFINSSKFGDELLFISNLGVLLAAVPGAAVAGRVAEQPQRVVRLRVPPQQLAVRVELRVQSREHAALHVVQHLSLDERTANVWL